MLTEEEKEEGLVKNHKKPKKLPPRNDLHKHKAEVEENQDEKERLDKEKEASEEKMEKKAIALDRERGLFVDERRPGTDPAEDGKGGHLSDVNREDANYAPDYWEANNLGKEDIDEILLSAQKKLNPWMMNNEVHAALANGLDYAIWEFDGGRLQHKISADLYTYLLDQLAKKLEVWHPSFTKDAGKKRKTVGDKLEELRVKRDQLSDKLQKLTEKLQSLQNVEAKVRLSMEAETKAHADCLQLIADEMLRLTDEKGYFRELARREISGLVEEKGKIRKRFGYAISAPEFKEVKDQLGKPTKICVFGFRLYKVFDGKRDKRIELTEDHKSIKQAGYTELMNESGNQFKAVLSRLKQMDVPFSVKPEGVIKIQATQGPYVLVSAEFNLAYSRGDIDSPQRKRMLRDDLIETLDKLSTMFGVIG